MLSDFVQDTKVQHLSGGAQKTVVGDILLTVSEEDERIVLRYQLPVGT